jgi:hypothetical protein
MRLHLTVVILVVTFFSACGGPTAPDDKNAVLVNGTVGGVHMAGPIIEIVTITQL